MKTGPKSRVAAPVPDEDQLAELVNAVRNGGQNATGALRHLFYRGTRFLIQRRVGSVNVEPQVEEILNLVFNAIRDDNSVVGGSVIALVRRLILQRYPTSQETSETMAKDEAVATAKGVLNGLSPVERDALRRCYVLRQRPESFLKALKLTPDQFRAIQSKVRTEFNTRHSQINVA